MTLVGATLRGSDGAAALPAIENSGALYARNVDASGYGVAIESTAGLQRSAAGPNVEEVVSHAVLSMFASPSRAMHLPVRPTPEVPWDDVLNKSPICAMLNPNNPPAYITIYVTTRPIATSVTLNSFTINLNVNASVLGAADAKDATATETLTVEFL